MKKMNMYEAPKAEVIEMQTVVVLAGSTGGGLHGPITPGDDESE